MDAQTVDILEKKALAHEERARLKLRYLKKAVADLDEEKIGVDPETIPWGEPVTTAGKLVNLTRLASELATELSANYAAKELINAAKVLDNA